MSFLNDCKELISIDSGPNQGTESVVNFISSLCKKKKITSKIISIDGIKSILINYDIENTKVLFHSDLSTLDPGPYSLWTETNQNPFETSIIKNDLYGLGVASSKTSILCQIYALEKLIKKEVKSNVALLGTGSNISEQGLKDILSQECESIEAVVVSHPTNLRPSIGTCAKANVKLKVKFSTEELQWRSLHLEEESTSTQTKIFRAKTSHGADPYREDGAFRKLLEYLEMMPAGLCVLSVEAGHSMDSVPAEALLELDLSKNFEDTISKNLVAVVHKFDSIIADNFSKVAINEYEVSLPKFNIGLVETLDEHVELSIQFYLPQIVNQEVFQSWLTQINKNLEDLPANIELLDYLPATKFNYESEKIDFIKDIIIAKNLNANELYIIEESKSRFYNNLEYPVLNWGAGTGLGNVFSPNEKINLSEMNQSIEIYEQWMEKL